MPSSIDPSSCTLLAAAVTQSPLLIWCFLRQTTNPSIQTAIRSHLSIHSIHTKTETTNTKIQHATITDRDNTRRRMMNQPRMGTLTAHTVTAIQGRTCGHLADCRLELCVRKGASTKVLLSPPAQAIGAGCSCLLPAIIMPWRCCGGCVVVWFCDVVVKATTMTVVCVRVHGSVDVLWYKTLL